MPNATLPADVERALAKRAAAPSARRVEKLADGPYAISLPAVLQDVDEATMSASFIISTADVDRSGDLVETAGIRLEQHRKNPVVLWDHGRGPIGKLPIGKCEDPDGNYTVLLRPDEGLAIARVFFNRDVPFARDVFNLVKDKCLRGASMGFLPLSAGIMPGGDPDDEDPPLHLVETELCEVSVTAVPDNPNALLFAMNKALGSGRSPEMAEYLKRFAGPEEKTVTTPAKNKSVKINPKFTADYLSLGAVGIARLNKALSEITGKSADDYLPMNDDGTVADKDALGNGSIDTGADLATQTKTDDAAAGVDTDVPAYKQPLDGPASQAAATDLHTRLMDIAEAIQGWGKRQENESFKAILDQLATTIQSSAQQVADFHDDAHPDAEPLSQPADEEEEPAEPTEGEEPAEPLDEQTKAARKLRQKAAKDYLAKRLEALRGKRLGPKLTTKAMSKRVSGICTKAAAFLEKAEEHDGEWSETHKAAAGYHGKALRGLCTKDADMPAGDDDAGMDMKSLKAENERLKGENAALLEKAAKAVSVAEKYKKACDKLRNKA